jgi:YVTN family beta-propeller protein
LNSKIVSTKITSSIFLAIIPKVVLVGTITAVSSLLFMIGVENVQAQEDILDIFPNLLAIDAPTGIAFDSVTGHMYLTDQHDDTVHVIDTNIDTGPEIIDSIPVGDAPTGVAHDPVNDDIYVTHQHLDEIIIITNYNDEPVVFVPFMPPTN